MVDAQDFARVKEKMEREGEQREQQRAQKLQQLQQAGNCLRCLATGQCAKCSGEGQCAACKGHGTQTKRIESQDPLKKLGAWFGVVESTEPVEVECDSCQGTGTCQGCDGTGECEFCQGSGYADPTQAPLWWIIKDGVRIDVSGKQACDFMKEKRGTIRVNGEDVVQSGHDLVHCGKKESFAIRSGFDDVITMVLTAQAVKAGLQVMSFHKLLNERQKTIGITGELAATKIPLGSHNVIYQLSEHGGGNGIFGKGKLDIPVTNVGGSARFQLPCPHGVKLMLTLSVLDSGSPVSSGSDGRREQPASRPTVVYDKVARQTFEFGEGRWEGDTLKMLVTYRDSALLYDFDNEQFASVNLRWHGYDRQGVKIVGPEYIEMPDLKLGETGRAILDVGNAVEGNMAELASIEIKVDEDAIDAEAVKKAARTPPGSKKQADQWYYAKDSKQRLGPFTTEQLRQLASAGALQPTDMVLKEGAQRWVQASSVGELAFPTSAASVPPPPPPLSRWYYARDGKVVGPVAMEEVRRLLASGALQPADYILKEGTQTWVTVNSVPEVTSTK
jgi:hypothetical protein